MPLLCSMPQQADTGSSAVSRAFEQALPLMLHWAFKAGTGTAEVSVSFLDKCMTACTMPVTLRLIGQRIVIDVLRDIITQL